MYDVVPYGGEWKRQVIALQRHLWRGDAAQNAAYLEWKYEQNPYIATPLISLAVHEGAVVGMRGMFGSCWEAGPASERFVIPCGDDLVIAPGHRHRGLFGRIMSATVAAAGAHRYPATFSLSAGRVALLGSLTRGWRALGPVHPVRRVGEPASWRWRLGSRLRALRGGWRWADLVSHGWRRRPFRVLDRVGPSTPGGDGLWCARAPEPEPMAELVKRLGHDGRLRHVRDAAYFAWRFRNPLHDYRFLLAGRDRLEGYLVLQAYRRTERGRVNIVDWEGATPAVRDALLRAAIAWGRFAELGTWTLGLPAAVLASLRTAGFDRVPPQRLLPEGGTVLVRALEPAGGAEPVLGGVRLLDEAQWDMRMLYSMAG